MLLEHPSSEKHGQDCLLVETGLCSGAAARVPLHPILQK